MKTNSTISVLMPVYNAQCYVAQAIESILNQTFEEFEFIIIDDGSTDESLKILKKYAAKDKRIQLMSRPNTGYVVALNEMVSLARGEFIARMDADDIALPERFALQVQFLQSNPDVVCVSGATELIDEQGRLLARVQRPETDTEIQRKLLAGFGGMINHPSAMIRKTSLVAVGGYDETILYVEDLDLWLKLGEIGKLANLKETLLKYRFHSQSICALYQSEQRHYAQVVCERAWQRRGIQGHFESTKPWRPGSDHVSRYFWMLTYGWWAFKSGQRQTAIIYGIRAIQICPCQSQGWQLLKYAVLKRLPKPESMQI